MGSNCLQGAFSGGGGGNGGSWTFLEKVTGTGQTSLATGTLDSYDIFGLEIVCSTVTTEQKVRMQLNSTTTGYRYAGQNNASALSSADTTSFLLSDIGHTDYNDNITVLVYNGRGGNGTHDIASYQALDRSDDGGTGYYGRFWGNIDITADITKFTIFAGSGNIDAEFAVWGRNWS